MRLPQRVDTHRLEQESEIYFKRHLHPNWTCHKPDPDYGIDLAVDIFDGDNATGRELLVQLKASRESNSTNQQSERIPLNVSTYNMLWDKLQVVMLVKYVASEQTAYWQLLSEVPEPEQGNDTMTIHIPRANVLSDIDWGRIRNYVEAVHLKKIGARRRHRFNEFA
jgi:hypothetical protein